MTKKGLEKQKFKKWWGGVMFSKWLGAFKLGAVVPLRTMLMGFLDLPSFFVLVILWKWDDITRQMIDELPSTKLTNFWCPGCRC